MRLLNPTGGTIRNDSSGGGYYKAPRESGFHNGIDFTLPEGVGQPVIAPTSCRIVRISYPYEDDQSLLGAKFEGADIGYTMWYFHPLLEVVGHSVTAGQLIGYAQDCREHYTHPQSDDLPHIHFRLDWINPAVLL